MALKTFKKKDIINTTLLFVKKQNIADVKKLSLEDFKSKLDPLDILIECSRYAENYHWVLYYLQKLLKSKKSVEKLYRTFISENGN